MVNRRYKVIVDGTVITVAEHIDAALRCSRRFVPFTKKTSDDVRRYLQCGRHAYYFNGGVRIEVIEEPKSYEQQELDSLGIGEDLIIRVQLSYNGKATKHLNITKEQFDAISKIIVDLL